jgi:hypothetical protein
MNPAHAASAFRGNSLGCHTIATVNAFFPHYRHIDALYFEALTGVPFGTRTRRDDPNRLIIPQIDPDEGLDRAFALLGVSSETQWFLATEGPMAWRLLKEWLLHSPVLLGPVDMGGLHYLPNPGLFRGCDHYVTAFAVDHNRLWLVDGEGACPVVVEAEEFMAAWEADGIPEGRGAFTLRRARCGALPEPGREALLGGLRQACRLVAEAAAAEEPGAYLALAEQDERILSWPAGRRGLEFLLPIRGQRNIAAMALIEGLSNLPECDGVGPHLDAIRDHLLCQTIALGRCMNLLLGRQKSCLEGLREVAWREAALAELFKELRDI